MIESENIRLRALEPEDVDFLYKWENETSLWYLSNTLVPFSRHVLEQFILNSHNDIFVDKQLRLMIDLHNKDENECIGSIDLFDFDPVNQRAGIGILITENHRQKGHAHEALQLLIDYCFKTLRLHQLYCNVSSDNEKSLNLFRKAGFKVTGKKTDWIHNEGNWLNEYTLQLINNS